MIVASNNKGKIDEIKKILSEYEIYSLADKGIDIDVLEDQDSFLGNAKKKAKEIYDVSHEAVIADDSGLCVTCLDDFPGVMTHRFLGDDATDRMRNEYLINGKKAFRVSNNIELEYFMKRMNSYSKMMRSYVKSGNGETQLSFKGID